MRDIHDVLNLLECAFSGLRILVVGDLMLDRYIIGEVTRISPEAPVPVMHYERRFESPGGAANVAMNLAGLGCKSFLAGFWGSDSDQVELAQLMDAGGIDTRGVVMTSLLTTSKTRFIGHTQQMLRLDVETAEQPSIEDSERLMDVVMNLISEMKAVILSDYAKGALTPELCQAVIRAARLAGIPVLVDPKTRNFSKYAGATTVCPNLTELSLATGVPTNHGVALFAAAQKLLTEHNFEYLTITMSEMGIRVLSREALFESPARAREVYDVSGAGDTVISTLAACLAAGLDREPSVELANLAAGIVVGKSGTVPILQHELVDALMRDSAITTQEKVLDLTRVHLRVSEWRQCKETIVFTYGCFDLLHSGHIALMDRCRVFGSKLIVGLNTDSSARRLDGDTRPVVGQRERARIIAALANVDAVVLFEQDTPLHLVQVIRPDVFVDGGDDLIPSYTLHKEVAPYVGRIETLSNTEDFSTR